MSKIVLEPIFPSAELTNLLNNLMVLKDPRWISILSKLNYGLNLDRLSIQMQGNPPKGYSSMEFPSELAKFLLRNNWNYLSRSRRCIFYKQDIVLKIALDSDGIAQNIKEFENWIAWRCLKADDICKQNVKLPQLIDKSSNLLWLIQQKISGTHPETIPDQIKNIPFNIFDINIQNVIVNEDGYWIIDSGM